MNSLRSWLFTSANNERFPTGAFKAGADAIVLDLENAVPPDLKTRASGLVPMSRPIG